MSTSPRPITLGDLGTLTTRGLTAFAARAARRAMTYYRPGTDDERTATEYFLNAIEYADNAARGTARELPADLVDELFALADQVAATAGYAGFAAAHAARVGTKSLAGVADDHTAHLDIVASTFGAARVLYTAGGDAAAPALDAAFRADFDKLVELALGDPGTVGRGIDPATTGPLGPLDRLSSPSAE